MRERKIQTLVVSFILNKYLFLIKMGQLIIFHIWTQAWSVNAGLGCRCPRPSAKTWATWWGWTETKVQCGCLPGIWGHSLPLELPGWRSCSRNRYSIIYDNCLLLTWLHFSRWWWFLGSQEKARLSFRFRGRSVCLLKPQPLGRYLSHSTQFEGLKLKKKLTK